MVTNWEQPVGSDIAKVLNLDIIKKANQNTDPDHQPANGQADTDLANRRDELVKLAIGKIRAAIINGGRIPLSLTPMSVPQGASVHVLFYAAWQLINTTPNLNMAILSEKGASMPYAQFYKESVDYIEKLNSGSIAPRPTDPTGADYATPVSATNAEITGVYWGDLNADGTDYDAGFVTTPSGVQITLPVDDMRTN